MSIEKPLMTDENFFERKPQKFLSSEVDNADSRDGVFQALTSLSKQVQEEFDKLLGEDTDKKCFLKSLPKIFAILLNTKVNTVEKIKKIIKIALENLKLPLKYGQGKVNSKNNG